MLQQPERFSSTSLLRWPTDRLNVTPNRGTWLQSALLHSESLGGYSIVLLKSSYKYIAYVTWNLQRLSLKSHHLDQLGHLSGLWLKRYYLLSDLTGRAAVLWRLVAAHIAYLHVEVDTILFLPIKLYLSFSRDAPLRDESGLRLWRKKITSASTVFSK